MLYEKLAQCDFYARGCDFRIWRTLSGVLLEEKEMKSLLEKGKTGPLKNLQDRATGKKVNGNLVFEDFKIRIES